jgi:hypothetical protein
VFVGAIAVLIWLADRLPLPGLDSGIWLFVAFGELSAAAERFGELSHVVRSGLANGGDVVFLLLRLSIPVVVLVFLTLAVRRRAGAEGGEASVLWSKILLWPMFLALTIGSYVNGALLSFNVTSLVRGLPNITVLMVLLIPIVVFCYGQAYREHGRRPAWPLLVVVAAVEALLLLLSDLVSYATPSSYSVGVTALAPIVVVVACVVIAASGRDGVTVPAR